MKLKDSLEWCCEAKKGGWLWVHPQPDIALELRERESSIWVTNLDTWWFPRLFQWLLIDLQFSLKSTKWSILPVENISFLTWFCPNYYNAPYSAENTYLFNIHWDSLWTFANTFCLWLRQRDSGGSSGHMLKLTSTSEAKSLFSPDVCFMSSTSADSLMVQFNYIFKPLSAWLPIV